MVANAKRAATPFVLSDDKDIATFAGITLYTANRGAINAARDAGKLVNPSSQR
jgi:hypothetical protein